MERDSLDGMISAIVHLLQTTTNKVNHYDLNESQNFKFSKKYSACENFGTFVLKNCKNIIKCMVVMQQK